MEWHQLKYFQHVAQTEHIGKASEDLHVTQPAISMSIKKLEDELGVELFDRSKKNIKINKYGQVYLKHVNAAMKELENGLKEIQTLQKNDQNRVTVMIPGHMLSTDITSRIISEIPGIVLQNLSIDYPRSIVGLNDGSIDMCLMPPSVEGDRYTFYHLEKQPLCIITSLNHPLANIDEIDLSELSEEKFILYPVDTVPRQYFEDACRKYGFSPNVIFECNSLMTLLSPVESGFGISVIPVEAFKPYELSRFHVIKLKDPNIYTTLSLFFRNDKPLKPMAEKMKNILLEYYPPISI